MDTSHRMSAELVKLLGDQHLCLALVNGGHAKPESVDAINLSEGADLLRVLESGLWHANDLILVPWASSIRLKFKL